jgi:hypothetical protein
LAGLTIGWPADIGGQRIGHCFGSNVDRRSGTGILALIVGDVKGNGVVAGSGVGRLSLCPRACFRCLWRVWASARA